jgi:hypothetical protein
LTTDPIRALLRGPCHGGCLVVRCWYEGWGTRFVSCPVGGVRRGGVRAAGAA